ncbi:MAG: trypsin-like peptidase domain-containing protein [Armatimonadetes bacterium]|nr:trypsin-like peptidase domain-containing protein [Armatimonadota bacterium]
MSKATTYFFIGLAVFGGAFAALRIDRYLAQRSVQPDALFQESAPISKVSLENVQTPADFRAAAKKLVASVVSVDRLERYRTFFSEETRIAQTGSGSGVIIAANGTIITNNHVVANADRVQVRLPDGRNMQATVVGTDPRSDLAVLKVDATGLSAVEMGESSKLEIGEWVLAVGSPLGFDDTVSVGVVSSLNRTLDTGGPGVLADAIQTDAAINPGNSGGALANAKGELIGINTAIASETGGSVGLGFAIPVNRVKRVASDILKFGRVRYGTLGVSFYRIPGLLERESAREQLKQATGSEPPKAGVVVQRVGAGSGAERAGMQGLDVVTEFDGQRIRDYTDLSRLLLDRRAGDTVKIKYWSKGESKSVSIVLQDQA